MAASFRWCDGKAPERWQAGRLSSDGNAASVPPGRRWRHFRFGRRTPGVLLARGQCCDTSPVSASAPAPVRASGVVVFRPGRRVLLVHRPRYDDWSFPKGKLDPGEHPVAAAVRETEEETGLHVRLTRPLADQQYRAAGRPKTVRYWTGRAVGSDDVSGYLVNHEIDDLRWVRAEDAARMLTYERDRATLAEAMRVRARTTAVVVLRHAEARSRKAWRGDDRERPLLERGHDTAQRLVPLLAAYDVTRVVTSSSARCVQTVAPFAETGGLGRRDPAPALGGGRRRRRSRRAGRPTCSRTGRGTVVCSHRPVLPLVFDALGLADPGLAPGEMAVAHVRKGRVGVVDGDLTRRGPGRPARARPKTTGSTGRWVHRARHRSSSAHVADQAGHRPRGRRPPGRRPVPHLEHPTRGARRRRHGLHAAAAADATTRGHVVRRQERHQPVGGWCSPALQQGTLAVVAAPRRRDRLGVRGRPPRASAAPRQAPRRGWHGRRRRSAARRRRRPRPIARRRSRGWRRSRSRRRRPPPAGPVAARAWAPARCGATGSLVGAAGGLSRTCSPVSSSISRTAAATGCSPGSSLPWGTTSRRTCGRSAAAPATGSERDGGGPDALVGAVRGTARSLTPPAQDPRRTSTPATR